MPVIFARVDDRLIHGQVVQAWLPQLNVDEVIIPCTKRNTRSLNRTLLRPMNMNSFFWIPTKSHVTRRKQTDGCFC